MHRPHLIRAALLGAGAGLLALPVGAQITVDYLNFHGATEGIAVDDAGHAYVVGLAGPLVGNPPCIPSVATDAAWIAKLDLDGEILWSRRIGASPWGITVDKAGQNVYFVGRGGIPSQFPQLGYDPTPAGGRDGFVARLDATNGCPISMTYFGDRPDPFITTPHDVAVDEATGHVHVVATTGDETYTPTAVLAGYIPAGGSPEAIAVGFDATLQTRNYFVYLPGGSDRDNAQAVDVDSTGIYISGSTESTDLTFSPQRIGPGGRGDAFVMKLDPTASTLLYATIIGGSRGECLQGSNAVGSQNQGSWLAIDDSGCVAVASWTASNDFPVTVGSAGLGQDDVFVTRLLPSGALDWSRVIGGSRNDNALGIARDAAAGTLYAVGQTKSSEFPVPGGLVTALVGRRDAFVVELDEVSGALMTGTLLGGSDNDVANGGVATDGRGGVYVTGHGSAGFQPALTSTTFTTNAFAAKLRFVPPPPVPRIDVAPTSGLETTEGGGTDAFDVVLGTQPAAPVAVDLWSSDTTEGLVSAAGQTPTTVVTLVFDSINWSTPQTVTVHGQQDPDLDGDVPYTVVTNPAVSSDPDYAALDATDVSVTNIDDEVAPGIAVDGISPGSMNAGDSVAVTITGSGFAVGAAVSLEAGTGPAPEVTGVIVVSETTITATFGASSAGPRGIRTWDVRVTNPDASTGVLAGGFQVIK